MPGWPFGARGSHVRGRRVSRGVRPQGLPSAVVGALVVALTGLSLGLGFYHLSSRSLWLDEGYTWLTAAQNLEGITAIAGSQGYHLLPYYLLIHVLIGWFGDSAFVMRAPSVIAGAASVPLMYLLASRLAGRRVGLYATVLLVVSQPLVFWQQNARDYAFVVLFAVASTLAAVVGLQRETLGPLVGWALIMAVGCYTHPEMLLLVVPQVLVMLLWSRSGRLRAGVIAITVAGGVLSLPVLFNAVHSSVYQTTPLLPPGAGSATEIATFLASGAGSGIPVTAADHALLGITFALAVIGVAILGADLVDRGCTRSNLGLGLGLAWLVLPPIVSWLVSETGHPDFLDRYLILSLPAASLVIAVVLGRIRPRSLGLFGLTYLLIFRFGVLAPSYSVPLDDFSTATAELLAAARPGDCVTIASNQARTLYDYYSGRLARASGGRLTEPVQVMPFAVNGSPQVVLAFNDLPPGDYLNSQQPQFVAQAATGCRRIWLFQSHVGSPTGSATSQLFYRSLLRLEKNLQLYYRPAGQFNYPGVAVTLFDRARLPG